MGCTLNCMATSQANSSLFFFLCKEAFSYFLELPPLPLRFLLRCYSISFDRTISSLSLLLENKPPCCSLIRPLNYRSNWHSTYFCQCDGYLAGEGLYSLYSFCFFTVAKLCKNCYCFYSWPNAQGFATGEWLCGGCGGASMGSPPKNLVNFSAWICFSYLARAICSANSMRYVTQLHFFQAACNCCYLQSSLQRRQKFWLKMRMRSFLSSYTSVVSAVMKRFNCFSS